MEAASEEGASTAKSLQFRAGLELRRDMFGEAAVDAIRIANDSNYGLNGSVLTHDADAAWRVGRRVRTGNVGQNGMRTDFSLPFSGYKQSGIGREGGSRASCIISKPRR